MTMAWNINKLRETGNSADAQIADMLELRLEARGDFDFPDLEVKTADQGTSEFAQKIGETVLSATSNLATIQTPDIVRFADSSENIDTDLPSAGELERISAFNMEMQEIFHPLLIAAKMKMPTETVKNRLWNSKRERPERHNWEYSEVIDNKIQYYKFGICYSSGKSGNKLNKLLIDFGGKETGVNDYFIEVDFDEDMVTRFYLGENKYSNTSCGTELRQLLRTYSSLKNRDDLFSDEWNKDILGGKIHPNLQVEEFYNEHSLYLCPSKDGFPHWIGLESHRTKPHAVYGAYDFRVSRKYNPASETLTSSKTYTSDKFIGSDINTVNLKLVAEAFMSLVPTRDSKQKQS